MASKITPRLILLDTGTGPTLVDVNQASIYPKISGLVFAKDENEVETQLSVTGASHTFLTPHTLIDEGAFVLSIEDIPATYDHLRLLLHIRSKRSSDNDNILIRVNDDDATSSYDGHIAGHLRNGTTAILVNSLYNNNQEGLYVREVPANSSSENLHAILDIMFYNYADTSNYRLIFANIGVARTTTYMGVFNSGCIWQNNVDAIASIQVLSDLNNAIAADSWYQLIGIQD